MDQRTSLPVAAAAAAEGRHIPALDGLRGLAILHVMLGHFCLNAKLGDTLKWKLAANAIAILPNGVELFFVLSGFLITGILIHSPLIVPVFGIAATGVCVGIAFASWHLFEKRFLQLKRYFPYRERTHVTSSLGL